jgi:Zn-dependent M28 family amino/carboxypeptidase
MVGRNSVDSLFIVGELDCPELAEITRQENSAVGFTFAYDNSVTGRSDHASFVNKNVPAIAYFSGFHPDYHKVGDNPEFINAVKVAKVAQLAFRTAWRIANDDKTYSIQKTHNP